MRYIVFDNNSNKYIDRRDIRKLENNINKKCSEKLIIFNYPR